MCDLHLPFDKNALQYDVLDWAVADIQRKKPDCIAYAGDVTCDGNIDVYKQFVGVLGGTFKIRSERVRLGAERKPALNQHRQSQKRGGKLL